MELEEEEEEFEEAIVHLLNFSLLAFCASTSAAILSIASGVSLCSPCTDVPAVA